MDNLVTTDKVFARYYAGVKRSARKLHFDLTSVRHAVRELARDTVDASQEITKEVQQVQDQLIGLEGILINTNKTIERVGAGINYRLEILIQLAVEQQRILNQISDYLAAPAGTAASERRNWGFTSIQNEEYAAAIDDFHEAIRIGEHDHIAWYGLGVAWGMLKDSKAAALAFANSSRKATRGHHYGDSALAALLCRASFWELHGDYTEQIWKVLLLARPEHCPDLAVPVAMEAVVAAKAHPERRKIAHQLLSAAFAIDPELMAVADSNELPVSMINEAARTAYDKILSPQIEALSDCFDEMKSVMERLQLPITRPEAGPAATGWPALVASTVIWKRNYLNRINAMEQTFNSLVNKYSLIYRESEDKLLPRTLAKPSRTLRSFVGPDPVYAQRMSAYNASIRAYNLVVLHIRLYDDLSFKLAFNAALERAGAIVQEVCPEIPRAVRINNELIRVLGVSAA